MLRAGDRTFSRRHSTLPCWLTYKSWPTEPSERGGRKGREGWRGEAEGNERRILVLGFYTADGGRETRGGHQCIVLYIADRVLLLVCSVSMT